MNINPPKKAARKFRNNQKNKPYPGDIQNIELNKTTDGTNNVMTHTEKIMDVETPTHLDILVKAAIFSINM